MAQQSQDPVQQSEFPVTETDAWVTHFLAVTLLSAAGAFLLFQEKPWDRLFSLGFGLTSLIAVMVFFKRKVIYRFIIAFTITLGVLSMTLTDPSFRYITWVFYSLILWATCMGLLRDSPGITDAPKTASVATLISGLIGYFIFNQTLQWQSWSVMSASLLFGCALFALTTHELD